MKMTPHELYKALADAMPADQIDHHDSDLYVKRTEVSTKIIHDAGVSPVMESTFVDQITHTVWYELYFCYSPYWEERSQK